MNRRIIYFINPISGTSGKNTLIKKIEVEEGDDDDDDDVRVETLFPSEKVFSLKIKFDI